MSNTNDISLTAVPAELHRAPLPPRGDDVAPEDGFVYVIEFSDKTIKIGRTRDLAQRSASHQRDGEKFGLEVVRKWGSRAHRDYGSTEISLKQFASQKARLQGGKEYFVGLDFNAAVRFVESLNLRPSTAEEIAIYEKESAEKSRKLMELVTQAGPRPSTHFSISIDDNLAGWPLQQYFRSDYPLPDRDDEVEGRLLDELLASVRRIDEMTGNQRGESVEDWSTVDLMEYLLDMVTETAKERLRLRVVNEERFDLLDPFFETAS